MLYIIVGGADVVHEQERKKKLTSPHHLFGSQQSNNTPDSIDMILIIESIMISTRDESSISISINTSTKLILVNTMFSSPNIIHKNMVLVHGSLHIIAIGAIGVIPNFHFSNVGT